MRKYPIRPYLHTYEGSLPSSRAHDHDGSETTSFVLMIGRYATAWATKFNAT
jgi:hypothetical protein